MNIADIQRALSTGGDITFNAEETLGKGRKKKVSDYANTWENSTGLKLTIPAGSTSANDMKIEQVKIEKVPVFVNHLEVDRIIYSGNKTIVIWKDKTKTIVSCSEGETFDEFDGFTAALAKKIYGSTCAVKREIKKHKQVDKVKKED